MSLGDAYLLSDKGHRIRQCYLRRKIEYDQFVFRRRPVGSSLDEYQKWNDWCAQWYGSLVANRDQAVQQAMARKREEKRCRKQHRQRR